MEGFKRLDRLTRAVENGRDPMADFDKAVERAWKISKSVGGRTVMDDRRGTKRKVGAVQGSLFRHEGI
jgi:hypothetical protein